MPVKSWPDGVPAFMDFGTGLRNTAPHNNDDKVRKIILDKAQTSADFFSVNGKKPFLEHCAQCLQSFSTTDKISAKD